MIAQAIDDAALTNRGTIGVLPPLRSSPLMGVLGTVLGTFVLAFSRGAPVKIGGLAPTTTPPGHVLYRL